MLHLLVLPALAMLVGSQQPRIVGRWDLSFQRDGGYPGWLEVAIDGDSLRGRFQPRGGHATPLAAIRTEGDAFRFLWPSEADPSRTLAEIVGTIGANDELRGTFVAAAGDRTPFTGVRAPALPAPARVEWAEPIDLLAEGLAGWRVREPGDRNGWTITDGVLSNVPPSADLVSRQVFADFRLRLEVNVPEGGNSGIYLRGRHEIQVQDDYGKEPNNRRMGGIYGQVTPTSLPARPAGEWQTLDITLLGRWVTVRLNGVTIIEHQEIPGVTGGALDSHEAQPGPLMLQGDHSAIRYRNIVLTPARGLPDGD